MGWRQEGRTEKEGERWREEMMAQERRAEWSAGESLSCGMHKIIIHKTLPLYSTTHSCVWVCVCGCVRVDTRAPK